MKKALTALAVSFLLFAVPTTTVHGAEPMLVSTTAYTEGKICSHGDRARQGIVAGKPEWYGQACIVYEAVPSNDGYQIGDVIGIYEVLDTGYGKSTKDGIPSKVRADKKSRGSIETGRCIDKYAESYADAVEWMRITNGMAFIQILKAEG